VRWELGEQRIEPSREPAPSRVQCPAALAGQDQRAAPSVAGGSLGLDEVRLLQRRYELRGRRARDTRAARQLAGALPSRVELLQREVLRERQRRLVLAQEALDPTADQWRDPREGK
jgi:hypothetical protein